MSLAHHLIISGALCRRTPGGGVRAADRSAMRCIVCEELFASYFPHVTPGDRDGFWPAVFADPCDNCGQRFWRGPADASLLCQGCSPVYPDGAERVGVWAIELAAG